LTQYLLPTRLSINLLSKVLEHVEAAKTVLENNTLDVVSEELKESIEELSSITSENISKDILETIFSRFCIGK